MQTERGVIKFKKYFNIYNKEQLQNTKKFSRIVFLNTIKYKYMKIKQIKH